MSHGGDHGSGLTPRRGEDVAFGAARPLRNVPKPLDSIWIVGAPNSVVTLGLKQALEVHAQVHAGMSRPRVSPSFVMLCADEADGASERVKELVEAYPGASILVFGLRVDLRLARAALRAGARGFVHAGMSPEQIVRAVEMVAKGEIVAPRKLLEHLILDEESADLGALSARQREVLGLVVEGLSNAEIGKRLYLSESTVKQHLRAAYKVLGVTNRTEAARLIHNR